MIPFNKIHFTGEETNYIQYVIQSGKLSGGGIYTNLCERFFEKKYGFKKALLTSSCTDALEMAALLINAKPGDEIIMPSYSFVSMANAFILRGVKIVFADSSKNDPNICADKLEELITIRTKAIVIIHYGGIACDIKAIKTLTDKYNLILIEDAAHAIDSYHNDQPLGSFGHLATFSFHETKNITCGEGGLLIINDEKLINRAEVIREKGTNRSAFNKKKIDHYNWIDLGSSFLASEITAAFLYAQLCKLDDLQQKRKKIWAYYYNSFKPLANRNLISLPYIPDGSIHNAHIFYLIFNSLKARNDYIEHMLLNNVRVQFHYITLHDSPFYKKIHGKRDLPAAKMYQDCLVRIPIFYDLEENEINNIIDLTNQFFYNQEELAESYNYTR